MREWTGPGWYQITGTTYWANGGTENVTKDCYLMLRSHYDALSRQIRETAMDKREAEFYVDKAGEWRWRVRDDNGEIIDAASEGFSSKAKAEYNYAQN